MEKITSSKQKFNSDFEDIPITTEKKIETNQNRKAADLPITSFYYVNKKQLTVKDLTNGRRIFNNKTEISNYNSSDQEFNKHFIEFRQLFFKNWMLSHDFTESTNQEPITVQSGLFSTFVYEGDFIEPLINTFKIKSLIIRHQEGVKYNQMEDYTDWIKFIHPKIDYTLRWGTFHSKWILLKFPDFLRVIIPSANLTNGDWYFWGQLIWFQDFPLLKENEELNEDGEKFKSIIERFLTTFMPHSYQGKRFWTDLNIDFNDYNYNDICIHWFPSANGRFIGEEANWFGVGRLNFWVKNEYKNVKKNNYLMIQCSSIGKTKKAQFYKDVYNGFNMNDNAFVDIIYPTEKYIDSFPLGKELTGCWFWTLDAYNYHKSKFKIMEMKAKYEDKKTVFHSKCFITGEKDKNGEFKVNDNSIIYFGSHNFSLAAFGAFEKNNTQVSMANYELGIIFNPKKISFEEKKEIFETMWWNYDARYYKDSEEDFPFWRDRFD